MLDFVQNLDKFNFLRTSLRTALKILHLVKNYLTASITQPTRGAPGTSPEGLLKVLTSGTSRGPLGDSESTNKKNWWFDEKSIFLDVLVFVSHIYYWFLLEKQTFKISKWGRPRDVCGTQLWDVPGTKWWDVLGTSMGRRSYTFFKFKSESY